MPTTKKELSSWVLSIDGLDRALICVAEFYVLFWFLGRLNFKCFLLIINS